MPTENRSSNTEMVSVPRELAENLAHALYEHDANGLTVQLQEWLDKPAEQHQGEPAGYFTFCHDKNKWLQGKPKGPEFLHFFTPLYTHADTGEVERLRAELADTREAYLHQSARLVKARQEIEHLKNPTFADTIKSPPTWVRAALSASAEPEAKS